jgi:hypothetical protein
MNHRESLKSVTLKICYSFLQQIGYIKSDHWTETNHKYSCGKQVNL